LSVDVEKQLFHCFGCGKSGDVIKFIQLKQGFDFKQAVEHLRKKYSQLQTYTHYYSMEQSNYDNQPDTCSKEENLNALAEQYHQALLNKQQALDYLSSRGITDMEIIKKFKIGYVNGYVTFPFFDEQCNSSEIYSRAISDNIKLKHKYLPGPHKGVLNLDGIKNSDEIYLCECVIDAISLFCMGIKNVTCSFGKGNVTEEMTYLIAKRAKKLYILYDNDGDDDSSAEKTAEIFTTNGIACERIKLPTDIKDVNDFLIAYLKEGFGIEEIKKKFEALERKEYTFVIEKLPDINNIGSNNKLTTEYCKLITDNHGILEYQISDRQYKIKNFKRTVMSDLRIFLAVSKDEKKYFANVDLCGEKSRTYFAENARERLGVSAFDIASDLEQLALNLDDLQESGYLKNTGMDEEELFAGPYEITEERYAQAVKNLTDKDYLTQTLPADMEYIKVVGEEENKILYAIAILSPKIAEQSIHILMTSLSGAGKSHVQKWIVTFFPAEDVSRISGASQQVLFYTEKDALKGKAISIDEDEGLQKSKYAIRTMMSEGRLELWVTEKDLNGKNRAVCKKNDGPCSILVSSTSLHSMDRETRSRMINAYGDESPEQTKTVQEAQVFMKYTKEGRMRTKEIPAIQQKHQDMMYVLRSTKNIKVEYRAAEQLKRVKLADDDIRSRRNCSIFMAVIEVIVKTRIYRKEIFTENGDRCIFVDDEDIDLGEKLIKKIFINQSADLKGALLRFYLQIALYVDSKRGEVPRNEHEFKGREIRAYTKLSKTEANENFQELVELEYLIRVRSKRGADTVYRLCDNDTDFLKKQL